MKSNELAALNFVSVVARQVRSLTQNGGSTVVALAVRVQHVGRLVCAVQLDPYFVARLLFNGLVLGNQVPPVAIVGRGRERIDRLEPGSVAGNADGGHGRAVTHMRGGMLLRGQSANIDGDQRCRILTLPHAYGQTLVVSEWVLTFRRVGPKPAYGRHFVSLARPIISLS